MALDNRTRREILGATTVGLPIVAGCVGGEGSAEGSQDDQAGDDEYNSSEVESPEEIGEREFSDAEIEDIRDQAERVDYPELMRNAEDYVGEPLYYRGDIVQVQSDPETEDLYMFRMNVNEDRDDIACIWQGERIIEDDWVDIYALGGKRFEYETVLGAMREIPLVYVVDLEIVNDEVED